MLDKRTNATQSFLQLSSYDNLILFIETNCEKFTNFVAIKLLGYNCSFTCMHYAAT